MIDWAIGNRWFQTWRTRVQNQSEGDETTMEHRKADRDGSRSGWHSNRVQFFFATLAKPGCRRGEPRDRQVEPRCFRRVRSTIEVRLFRLRIHQPRRLWNRGQRRDRFVIGRLEHPQGRVSQNFRFPSIDARKENVNLENSLDSLVHFRKTKEVKGGKRRGAKTFRGLRTSYLETRKERVICPFWFFFLGSRNSPLTRPLSRIII